MLALDDGSLLPTLDDFDPAGKTVLVRTDYNVPLEGGRVANDARIRASLWTIGELLDGGAALVLMSHLGRPKGIDDALRMAPVGLALEALVGRDVATLSQVSGELVEAATQALAPGDILLLENLRFDPGEKGNSPDFAADLARLADVYVDDAFGTAHRAAASTVGVAELLPGFAGRLMERELTILQDALHRPERPFAAVLGGAKISDKIGVLDNVAPKADVVIIGGAMANTFLGAAGIPMGDSLMEPDSFDEARRIWDASAEKIALPVDLVIADAFDASAATRVVDAREGVPDGWRALDIGPRTLEAFGIALAPARTVVWNGPMGAFEMAPFAKGTYGLAEAIARLQARSIVGGGDSAAAIEAAGLAESVDWISTGGGAMLQLLAGEKLPAVQALIKATASD